MSNFPGKGDWPRPSQVGREERELRKDLIWGEITQEEFDRRWQELKKQGKITRSGRVIQ